MYSIEICGTNKTRKTHDNWVPKTNFRLCSYLQEDIIQTSAWLKTWIPETIKDWRLFLYKSGQCNISPNKIYFHVNLLLSSLSSIYRFLIGTGQYAIVLVSTQEKGSKEQRDSVKSLCENKGKGFGAKMKIWTVKQQS